MDDGIIFIDSSTVERLPNKRPGMTDRILIGQDSSPYQNAVIVDFDQGAEVEYHGTPTSESIFVLSGEFEVATPRVKRRVTSGVLCHFPPNALHSLRCTVAGSLLITFAPSSEAESLNKWLRITYTSSEAESLNEWLRITYTTAWAQYSHEDTLGQARNTLFIGLNAAFVAILAALAPLLARIKPVRIGEHKAYVGLACLGLLAIFLGVTSSRLITYWRSVAEAGRAYVKLRHMTARAIETHLKLAPVAMANAENEWRRHSVGPNRSLPFDLFPNIPEMSSRGIQSLNVDSSGWASIRKTSYILGLLWIATAALGVVIFGWCLFSFFD